MNGRSGGSDTAAKCADQTVRHPKMQSSISISAVNPNEAASLAVELAPLHAQLFDTPYTAVSCENLLTHAASMSFLAKAGIPSAMAGFLIGRIAADEVEIVTIAVAPDYQRCGIGRMLLDAMINDAQSADVKTIFLEVDERNAPAVALYHSHRFKETGRRKGYYATAGSDRVDALVMRLHL